MRFLPEDCQIRVIFYGRMWRSRTRAGAAKEMLMPNNHLQKQVEQDRPVREGTVGDSSDRPARKVESLVSARSAAMPEVVADPLHPSCSLLFSRPGIEECQSLGPDPFWPRGRDARGRFAKGNSGNTRGRPRGIPNPRRRVPNLIARPLERAPMTGRCRAARPRPWQRAAAATLAWRETATDAACGRAGRTALRDFLAGMAICDAVVFPISRLGNPPRARFHKRWNSGAA